MQLRGERLGDRKEEEESGGNGRVREKRRWEGRRGEGREKQGMINGWIDGSDQVSG